ncbi:hypothetical protein ORJ04_20410 [Rheinheimera baltica]|uniref:PRTase-CE domain-containing protein n=1 Tax=Rheinheimera baltica TaxID=67576 RepID=A0ABT9I5M8_9GAMM|nr:hypothetical protein [Rheinheimera baltica]MDP5138315.1 hypothetical protein [Rheinheimera baltica]MDP5150496.1 hypothetical protein [Rheinheimera baltica]
MFERDNRDRFYAEIVQKTTQYIDLGLWSGIELNKFDRWIGQYKSNDEKILAALILESLVYRSKEHLSALIEHAIYKSIPQALFEYSGDEAEFRNIERVCNYGKNLPHEIAIVPVIRDADPPTKSGPLVARLFKRLGKVNDKLMYWPWQISSLKDISTIIFVDDFVGTGNQFIKFINNHVVKNVDLSKFKVVYCPLTATEVGLNNISKTMPEIILCPIELVSDSHNFFIFCAKNFAMTDDELTKLNEVYFSYLKKVKLDRLGRKTVDGDMSLGYGSLALTYAYEHATPNASLPLLWANSDNYMSLFER